MAKNPKWWKDADGGDGDTVDEGTRSTEKTSGGFDPSAFDGKNVDKDALNHEQLDAVIAHRQLDTTDLASDATKAQKAEFINSQSVI